MRDLCPRSLLTRFFVQIVPVSGERRVMSGETGNKDTRVVKMD